MSKTKQQAEPSQRVPRYESVEEMTAVLLNAGAVVKQYSDFVNRSLPDDEQRALFEMFNDSKFQSVMLFRAALEKISQYSNDANIFRDLCRTENNFDEITPGDCYCFLIDEAIT